MFGDEYVQYRKRTVNGIPFQGAAVDRRLKQLDRLEAAGELARRRQAEREWEERQRRRREEEQQPAS
jgi:hypothetical protein